MSNNYETITVLTDISAASIQPHHRALLEEMGFKLEENGDVFYLYAEDPSLIVSSDFLAELDAATAALPLLVEAKRHSDEAFWPAVFQDILKAPAMAGVAYIDLMASYTCSRARPGEHGGWAARITRHETQHMNTSDAFREWDAEPQRIKDIEVLCDLAIRTATTSSEREATARLGDYISNHPLVEYAEDDANGNAGKSGSE